MLGAAVTARTRRQRADQINFGKEFKEVAGPDRAGFHEILMRVVGESGCHEDIEHVMHDSLGLGTCRPSRAICAGQVGMAADGDICPPVRR